MPIPRLVLTAATAAVATSVLVPLPADAASRHLSAQTGQSVSAAVDYGVYAGPGSKGVAGAAEWSTFSGQKTTRVIDFLGDESFAAISNTGWLVGAHQGKGLHLDLGIPMLPKDNSGTLAQCAAGAYNAHWTKIGTDLVKYGQSTATLRVGWEMNGSWYKWSAAKDPANWVGCYRQIVDSTRAAAGQNFTYSWTVNVGSNQTKAETVYPGDDYVDYVGVNTYDMSWTWYPVPAGTSTATARANAWKYLKTGDHGLDYWVAFAKAHNKSVAIPEWGVVSRADGHGGNDNPDYINSMLDFVADPNNRVAYAAYFNDTNSTNAHTLTGATKFPQAAAALQARFAIRTIETPVVETPATETATTETPKTETPKAEAPATEAPITVVTPPATVTTLAKRSITLLKKGSARKLARTAAK